MADIVAANVTSVKLFDMPMAPREPGSVRRMIGVRITVATNTDYDTTTEIPLDNLFSTSASSYIALKKATCTTFGTPQYVSSTNHYPAYFDWANMKLRILKTTANAASADVPLTELTDAVAVGTGTCDVIVIGDEA